MKIAALLLLPLLLLGCEDEPGEPDVSGAPVDAEATLEGVEPELGGGGEATSGPRQGDAQPPVDPTPNPGPVDRTVEPEAD